MSTTSAVTSSTTSDRLIGRVKWFNNKAGYGFITVTDGDKSGTDIFTHHSSIGVASQQYKYLVQGEYVEFSLSSVQNGTHEVQSANVSGIKGGKLMCETRNEYKISRNNHKSSTTQQSDQGQNVTHVKMPRQQKVPEQDNKEWSLVKKTSANTPQSSPNTKPNSGRGRGRPRTTLDPKKVN